MGRKKKKKAPPEGPAGAPEWVVTFTDMISLLVTFFVLLMTFSSIQEFDLLKVDSWLSGEGGSHKVRGTSVQQPMEDVLSASDIRRGASSPHSRPAEELSENLAEMGQKKTDEHQALDLNQVNDGLAIEFGPDECFAPGSAQVPRPLARRLGEIGRVLEHYPHLVVTEGYTDGAFQSTPRYPTAEALAFARASAAARILLRDSNMRPELLQVAGLGSKPRADDETVEGRHLNRRVELHVISLSKLRSNHLESMKRTERGG